MKKVWICLGIAMLAAGLMATAAARQGTPPLSFQRNVLSVDLIDHRSVALGPMIIVSIRGGWCDPTWPAVGGNPPGSRHSTSQLHRLHYP